MSTSFEPRTFVNGALLKQFAGQSVSIIVRVDSVAGTTLIGESTDGHKLRISLPDESNLRKGSWVEVIGIPGGSDALRGKEVIEFTGTDFDAEGYNGMTHLLNNVKDFYRYG
ncbi:replication protein A 14 kDa subunit [Scaptodrosophila lebanonensis]|uniref:Replication protein A 14 kDa subunit n=1 Tax=Drosophila lebanonensis TaxID=7225 RepID=A0A6J2TQD6_DROLE|nr:replication protein A 14 kDa subunit [Scaptodrosophila lebanonensis]